MSSKRSFLELPAHQDTLSKSNTFEVRRSNETERPIADPSLIDGGVSMARRSRCTICDKQDVS